MPRKARKFPQSPALRRSGSTGLVLWRRRPRWTSLACPALTRRLAVAKTSRSPTASGCSRSRWAGPGGLYMSATEGSPGLGCYSASIYELGAPQLLTGSWGTASPVAEVPEMCSTGRPWGRRQPGLASHARCVHSCVLTELPLQWGSAAHLAAARVPAQCAKVR